MLSTVFYPQMDRQIESQYSTIKTYLRIFVNWEQNNWARLLLIAEFAYNNAKNGSTSYTSYEHNCDHYSHVSFEDKVNSLNISLRQQIVRTAEGIDVN